MSGTTQSPTAAFIDATGIHPPSFDALLSYFQGQMRLIYGSDIYLGNDSQDGQLIGLLSAAVNDTNAMAVGVYNSYSPSTGQGTGLSSNVKLNGLKRLVPTSSTVDLLIGGTVGTTITDGYVKDPNGIIWYLPQLVVIPASGALTVTATCANSGATTAAIGTAWAIGTPVRGWQTVSNAGSANAGAPVESDAALRRRQASSTMLPALSALEAIAGEVESLTGVTAVQPYENDSNIPDANGLPPHSIAIVAQGGDAAQITNAIARKKTPGAQTYGSTSSVVIDVFGIPHTINFFRPTLVPISVGLTISALPGYTSLIGNSIVSTLNDYINSSDIGGDVYLFRVSAIINSVANFNTFNIKSITMSRNAGTLNVADVPIAFNELAFSSLSLITLTVG